MIGITRISSAACILTLAASAASLAQAPGVKRTLLQRTDVNSTTEAILGVAEIAPGGSIGRHTHFGFETGYVIAGSFSLEVEGETPKLLKAGDSYTVPANKVHDAKAVGEEPAKVVATYVVEKGKPLATPAK
jgi:quercetin dioxygenase-like cupin family protein